MSASSVDQEQYEIPELIYRILAGRGMSRAQMGDFLYPRYEAGLNDPYLLSDMDLAVKRIELAIARKESVVVYGDYDIDGITASCVMLEVLLAVGIEARSYIPDRFEEGYGINMEALKQLNADGVQLVISVDCGITSVIEAKWAKENGLDLIITDHHVVPDIIPQAVAVINPKRPNDQYPFKDLAGVGVAFKLACAIQEAVGKPAQGQEKWWLDLVALGTVCDVVPLVGENRVLASYGLRVVQRTKRLGLSELCAVGGIEITSVTAHHLGYVLGPRMNAAGRLQHAMRSVELLRTGDRKRATQIAGELDMLNKQRRADQDMIFIEADLMAEEYSDAPVLVLSNATWSHGVVGIVASKLVEKWHKPVLLAQNLGEYTKGSARSVVGFDMVDALRANSDVLTKFGGHYFAAGYTFPSEHIERLRGGLCEYHRSLEKKPQSEAIVISAEILLDDLASVDLKLISLLERLEPYGSENPVPLVQIGGLKLEELRKVGADMKHLRLVFSDKSGMRLTGIGFGLAARYPELKEGQIVFVTGELNKNEWRGSITPQLVIRDIRHD
jgi:single-stranded-DNA-specific exonuclease